MILIVAALKAELLPIIEQNNITQKKHIAGGTLHFNDELHLLRTGVGAKKAEQAFSAYLKNYRPSGIFNIGMAGGLNPDIKFGAVRRIRTILNERHDKIDMQPVARDQQYPEEASLLTVSTPVTDQRQKENLYRQHGADMADMEAFILAETALKQNMPFQAIKIISDTADKNTQKDFRDNYKKLTKILGAKVIELIT